jgi:CRISPR/Cas system CSM-associated protein Csm3 (group 7 of RAMP superfamily)
MKIVGKIKALSPLHIGGEKQSNLTTCSRITTKDGEDIVYIPGNSIRGYLRRLLVEDFCKNLQITEMTEKQYFFNFVGGALSSSKNVTDMEEKRNFFMMLPHIRFFGTSYNNETIQGKLCVSNAMPFDGKIKTEFIQMTRKDDLKSDMTTEIKIIDDESEKQKEQMIFYVEAIQKDSEFEHEFFVHNPSELDKSIMSRIIELWQEQSFIGGLSARGFGKIKIDYDFKINSKEYFTFIKENEIKIKDLLLRVK